MTKFSGKLDSIQALRGLAALLVALFHCAGVQKEGLDPSRIAEISLLSGFWDRGYAGVDLFFVISGFIMVYVTHDKTYNRKDIGRFLYKRVTRIYPLWWVFASFMALYFLISYGQAAPPDRVSGMNSLSYLIKSFLLIPQHHVPILGVGWTLIHEVYFYIIFAGFLFFDRTKLPFLLGGWAALILLGTLMSFNTGMSHDYPSLVSSLLTLEFIAGAFAALLITRGIFRFEKTCLILGVISVILAMIFYTGTSSDLTSWGRVVVYTVPFTLMTYGAVVCEKKGYLNYPKFLVSLGNWSYSLYLSHFLVFLTIRRVLEYVAPFLPEQLQSQAPGWIDNFVFSIIALAATIIFSALCYRFIERPLLKLSRRAFEIKPKA